MILEGFKATWRDVRQGIDEWATEGIAFGAALREAAFGGLRLGSALASIVGFALTEIATEAELWLDAEEANRANASVRARDGKLAS